MELWQAIEKRRTIRKFSAPPTVRQLERVLDVGARAPSAGNRQAWFVVVVNESKTRERLGDIKKNLNSAFTPDTDKGRDMLRIQKDAFNNCTSLVFYTYAPEPSDPHRYDMGSVWLLIENLCLAAVEEGLGTQIVAFWDDAEKEVDQLLGIPEKYRQVVAVNMGVPHPNYQPPAKVLKPKSKWIFKETWPND